jgi:hypothetical protein
MQFNFSSQTHLRKHALLSGSDGGAPGDAAWQVNFEFSGIFQI